MGGWGMEEGVPPPPAENLFMPPTPRKILPQVDSPHHQQILSLQRLILPPAKLNISLLGAWGDGGIEGGVPSQLPGKYLPQVDSPPPPNLYLPTKG